MQKDAERCQTLNRRKHTLSSQYVQTYAATLSALNACIHMLRHVQLSKRANTRRHTLDTCRHMHTRAPLLIQANKYRHTLGPQYVQAHAQLSRHRQTGAQLSTQETE
jgi:hypothetical protein